MIGWIIGFILTALLIVLSAIGWFMNIMALVAPDFMSLGETIVRVAGIFVYPLGALLGWFL